MISIVIPTFNEVQNIIPLIKNLVVLVSDFEYEIIVVDDDSPDGTSEEVNKYMKLNNKIRLITRIGRSGLSSAIKEGLIFAQGKYLLVLDGDGQHHPSFILNMLEEIQRSKSDIVIGSRFLNTSKLEGLSNERSLGSKIANKMGPNFLSNHRKQISEDHTLQHHVNLPQKRHCRIDAETIETEPCRKQKQKRHVMSFRKKKLIKMSCNSSSSLNDSKSQLLLNFPLSRIPIIGNRQTINTMPWTQC